jgi:hypothetical protein
MANIATPYTLEHNTIKAQEMSPKKTVRPIKIISIIKMSPHISLDEQLLCVRHNKEFFAKCLQGFTARMPRMPYRDSIQAVNRSRRQKYSRAEYIIAVHQLSLALLLILAN